ncbi:MAG: hypothetical protein C0621_03810 [Desulfuromonas sp.]|nr:MAG: hypothetical protein C0621_03810 [Desulfuromonas sp.]
MIRLIVLSLLVVCFFGTTAWGADPCIDCHREKTPAAVRQWEVSAHVGKVDCAGCHGSDHEALLAGLVKVGAATCGRCHEKALHDHRASRHGMSLHAGWGCTRNQPDRDVSGCRFCHEEGSTLPKSKVQCARFLTQSPEMRELGCNRCHQVEDNCGSCHSNHMTDLAIVRSPQSCAPCHMGPDHAQWEMWQTSQHGGLYASMGGEYAPDCQRCHMPQGSHNVSKGLTSPPSMIPYPVEKRTQAREEMLVLCAECHAKEFARRELAQGDGIRDQSLELIHEAKEIIIDLKDRGLIDPAPEERPPHPLAGNQLVLDGQMLYEDYSHIERLFFKMKKYDLAKTVKGAYHQNPAYTHWIGNAELKMDLVDIKSEAQRLQKTQVLPVAAPDPTANLERELQTIKNRFDRGALSREEYDRQRNALLETLQP